MQYILKPPEITVLLKKLPEITVLLKTKWNLSDLANFFLSLCSHYGIFVFFNDGSIGSNYEKGTLRNTQHAYTQGREFTLWFFERIAHFLWAKEQFTHEKELINHGKERLRKEWQEQFALGHKKGGNQWRTVKNIQIFWFFRVNRLFFRGIP